eukprot:jgi/Mesen1/4868/ME000244S04056
MSTCILFLLLISQILLVTRAANADETCTFNGGAQERVRPSEGEVSSKLFIKGGIVVNADRQHVADVYVEDGIIQAVGPNLEAPEGATVLDASGKYVMPGGIDPHTHLAMPFMGTESCDDYYSGQAAALAGGTTMVIDFALPVDGDLARGLQAWQKKAELAVMDYGFHMAVTTWNSKVADDMATLVAKGQRRPAAGGPGHLQAPGDDDDDGPTKVHAENGDAVEAGRQRVVASGLALEESHMWNPNFTYAAQYVMSPPIRSAAHRTALRNAFATGVLQLVATDHAPFNAAQKAKGAADFRLIPNGVNGVEERMHIVWDIMIFNIYPQKGIIAPGADADIIILDPQAPTRISASSHHSRMDTNIYEGWAMKVGGARGNIETTISQGRLAWHEGRLNVRQGAGRFIPMKPFGPLYRGLDTLDEALLATM